MWCLGVCVPTSRRFWAMDGIEDTPRLDVAHTMPHSDAKEKALPEPPSLAKDKGTCCVLFWMLSSVEHERVSAETLVRFHEQIQSCVEFFEASVLMHDAVSGLIQGSEISEKNMTPEDATLRLGQCLCRWAIEQTPHFGLRLGVHTGDLKAVRLPKTDVEGFFGAAYKRARELASSAQRDCMVHVSRTAKDRLRALETIPLMISPNRESYLLDALTVVPEDEESQPCLKSGRTFEDMDSGVKGDKQKMSMEEFCEMLNGNNVDMKAFGKDNYKTIEEFYDDVVLKEKSYLVDTGGTFERVVPLLCVSLRVVDSAGRLRELRIISTTGKDGAELKRNQQLGLVLTIEEAKNWRKAVESCFVDKFNFSGEDQKKCLDVDHSSYVTKEERKPSDTVPSIQSVYKSHNVVIHVKDKENATLSCIGLPECKDFKTWKAGVEYDWSWSPVGTLSKEDELMQTLESNGIDMTAWSAEAFAQLYTEVHESGTATLEKKDDVLLRTMRIVKIWVHAAILTYDHVLVMKMKVQNGKSDERDRDKPVSMQMVGNDWEANMQEALCRRLGMAKVLQDRFLRVDSSSYKFSEEMANSRSFPGLKTVYLINEVTVHVTDPTHPDLHFLGLPDGNDFSFARTEAAKVIPSRGAGGHRSSVGPGYVFTHWCWTCSSDAIPVKVRQKPSFSDSKTKSTTEHKRQKLRVPAPKDLMEGTSVSNPLLARLMENQTTDWDRGRNAAQRICDADYSCKDYFQDITAAFPELRLYVFGGNISSGRTPDEEYQRTIGALFAVYWLMRQTGTGKESFCFGLKDDDWVKPRTPEDFTDGEFVTRKTFWQCANWERIVSLFTDAGLLLENGRHDPERTLAMLVLMAIHDVFKVTALLPVVEESVGEFSGYKVGETISDHDIALSYVLEHHPSCLPSFDGLLPEQKESVRFTHSKIDYNMGWLVQAEAPPGALFKAFKKVVISGAAKSKDIAFYFVHWFVDLAGAEPYPLEGCEKFVLKFPLKVLQQFLDSFSIVNSLGTGSSETNVYENYIRWRWANHTPSLGNLPQDSSAIAIMRLVIMAQGDSSKIVKAFGQLEDVDRHILSTELAITGIDGQSFSCCSGDDVSAGPALLVYYAPALMQKAGRHDPLATMRVLAEVLRKARKLWELQPHHAGDYTTVRIDHLKDCDSEKLLQPDHSNMWVIQRCSVCDGTVKQVAVSTVATIDWTTHVVLEFLPKAKRR